MSKEATIEALMARMAKMEEMAILRATAEKSQAHTYTPPGDQSRAPNALPDAPNVPPDAVAKTVEGQGEVVRSSRGWKGHKEKLLRLLRLRPARRDGK